MFFKRRRAITWPDVLARVSREFPDVRQMNGEELADLLARDGHTRPVVLDVRDADEYAISHIPGARHVLPESSPATELADLDHEQLVVAYCAAGIRASRYVKKMMAAGFSNAANLQGAIFEWANNDRPLEAAGQPTNRVHACDKHWCVLLREDLRAMP